MQDIPFIKNNMRYSAYIFKDNRSIFRRGLSSHHHGLLRSQSDVLPCHRIDIDVREVPDRRRRLGTLREQTRLVVQRAVADTADADVEVSHKPTSAIRRPLKSARAPVKGRARSPAWSAQYRTSCSRRRCLYGRSRHSQPRGGSGSHPRAEVLAPSFLQPSAVHRLSAASTAPGLSASPTRALSPSPPPHKD